MKENPRQYRPASEKPKATDPPKPESQESQPLPSVWDVLERRVRLNAPDVEDRPRGQEYKRELGEVNRLKSELYEKGTARENLILRLHISITMEPTGTLPIPLDFRDLSLEEFQQFRSKVEPMSDEEIAEEILKAEEEFRRKSKAKPFLRWPPDGAVHV